MKLKLLNVRIAFCQNLFSKGGMPGDPEDKHRFSSTFIIDGEDKEQLENVSKVIKSVAKDKWNDKADGILKKIKADKKICLKPGDDKTNADGEVYEGFEGNYCITASNTVAPLVIGRNRDEVIAEDSGKLYAGCYVNCMLDIWPQDNSYGKRINAKVTGVQFVKDGDSFGSSSAPARAEEFDDLGTDEEVSDDLY